MLPKTVQAWLPLTSLLPKEIGPALGRLAQKLNQWVGPLPRRQQRGPGLPDGYEGFHRAGSYEQLLVSEWLLATEIPEEFQRRAIMKEHLFLKNRRLQKRQAARSVVLFDMGPTQLGAPRIVQLALVMMFAHRAQRAQSQFQWGVLQAPMFGLQPCPTENFAAFVRQRYLVPVAPAHLDKWREILSAEGLLEDLWAVGDPQDIGDDFSLHIGIEELWGLEHRQVQITLNTPKKNKQLTLELPQEADCSRLLRNPARCARPVPKTTPVLAATQQTNILFNNNGRHLMYRTPGGHLALHAIPNSPKAPPGNPKFFVLPPDHFLLAATVRKKGISAITTTQKNGRCDALYFHRIPAGCPPQVELNLSQHIQLEDNGKIIHPFYFTHQPNDHLSLWICDQKKQLRKIVWPQAEKGFRTIAKGLIGSGPLACGGLYYALFHTGSQQVELVCQQKNQPPQSYFYSVESDQVVQLLNIGASTKGAGTVAIQIEPTKWRLFYGKQTITLSPAPGAQVIGMASRLPSSTSLPVPVLFVVTPDRTQINMVSTNQNITVVSCPQGITYAVINPVRPEIVYINTMGELLVYSIEWAENILHLADEPEP